MDRTLVGDLQDLRTLLLREVAGDRDLPLDPIEHALLGFTFGAVVRVDLEWRRRTVPPVTCHAFRRAYSAMVMEVQAPSADRKSTRLNSSH